MRTLALSLLSLTLCLPARADQLTEPSSEVKFERAPTVAGKPFLCLGTGIRKKAIFKVYAIAFCVEDVAGRAAIQQWFEGAGRSFAGVQGEKLAEKLADDPDFFRAMMALPVEKYAQLVFVRDVSKEKMRDAFDDSLTKALGKTEKARIDKFVGLLDRDLKDGDKLELITRPDGAIEVGFTGDLKGLTDPILAAALWTPYLGPDSVAPKLKESVAKGVAGMRK